MFGNNETIDSIKVISAFPGTGKSWWYEHYKHELKVYDSDSSKFSWIEPGVRNPEFPNNYIKHIKEIYDEADIIFVSSHKAVRDALNENGITFYGMFPTIGDKDIYLERYKNRGSSEEFISMMDKKYESFIKELNKDSIELKYMIPIVMQGDVYIDDYCIYLDHGPIKVNWIGGPIEVIE